jgi:hypothetical protein
METNTPRRASRSNRSSSSSSQAPLDRRFEDPARLAKLLLVIREAIDGKGRLRIRFRGFDRLIQPHRLWIQPDGTFLLEAYQVAGGSAWGDMGHTSFSRSRLGGWEGWISFPVELLETAEISGGPFEPHPDYNPEPVRLLGEIDRQVGARRDEDNGRFPDGMPVAQ